MMLPIHPLRTRSFSGTICALACALALAPGATAFAGQTPQSTDAATPQQTMNATPEKAGASGAMTDEELRQLLLGKPLFLRGGYLSDTLSFDEHGGLTGNSPRGSYTLCVIQFDKARLTKKKVELEGARYGMHFLGALPYEDPTNAVDRVKITPKKKRVKITIDRELVVKAKKVKAPKSAKGKVAASTATLPSETGIEEPAAAGPAATGQQAQPLESEGKTTSPAHAKRLLTEALDRIFAQGLDERMVDAMPDFWKLYYQAAAAKTDYKPSDPAVLRQSDVDQKAKLLSTFEPGSNEYAQAAGVAGMALYHAVVGSDGKPGEIAVARPIGFGLDESAVDAIRTAKFEPAMKDGKTVPVLLDLVVQFRIYSNRTSVTGASDAREKASEPVSPGPYSVQHP